MVTLGMRTAMVAILLLCAATLLAFGLRFARRRDITGYHALSELGAHLPQALGMIAMTVVMGGWVRNYGSRWLYVAGFVVLSAVFLVAAVRDRSRGRSRLWHVVIPLTMAYTFTAFDVAVLTWLSLLLLLLLAVDYAWGAARQLPEGRGRPGRRPSLYLAGTVGHLTIAASTALMLVTMQWPRLFA